MECCVLVDTHSSEYIGMIGLARNSLPQISQMCQLFEGFQTVPN